MKRLIAWWQARKRLAGMREHLTLKQRHMGLCPFCPVVRISFCYAPHQDKWRCDNCDAQGNLAQFIQRFYDDGKSKGERLKEQGDAYMAQYERAREEADKQREAIISEIRQSFNRLEP